MSVFGSFFQAAKLYSPFDFLSTGSTSFVLVMQVESIAGFDEDSTECVAVHGWTASVFGQGDALFAF